MWIRLWNGNGLHLACNLVKLGGPKLARQRETNYSTKTPTVHGLLYKNMRTPRNISSYIRDRSHARTRELGNFVARPDGCVALHPPKVFILV